ncbi:MAG TPA: T9SS type A sorting domain-containing protein [Flavipsychrobacter sp.]|nr:T9SS type A sorting domain-containing protein [Flavipsychrobacter sp.]
MKLKFTLFAIVSILFWTISAKAQTASRLIALTSCAYDGTIYSPQDSGTYSYSMGRGIGPNGHGWLYDLNHVYAYNNTTSKYSNSSLTTQTFDAKNNLSTVLVQSWDTSSSSWANVEKDIIGYDADNNATSYTGQAWNPSTKSWQNSSEQLSTFDSKNNMINRTLQRWDIPSSSWVGFEKFVYAYNSSNKLTTYSLQSWDTTSKSWATYSITYYRYDMSNNDLADSVVNWNKATSSWTNYDLDLYTYNSANKVLTQIHQQWYLGAWLNYQDYLFTYDTSGYETSQTWQKWVKGAWLNNVNFIYNRDASHINYQFIYQNWDTVTNSWLNATKAATTDNTYNQPLIETDYEWDAGSSKWVSNIGDRSTRYYYETYTTSVGAMNTGGSIKIYPSPANSILDIDIKWDEVQTGIIAIYDMQGRLWHQWQTANGVAYHNSISVAQLPAGNYILKIRGENGQLADRFSVMH